MALDDLASSLRIDPRSSGLLGPGEPLVAGLIPSPADLTHSVSELVSSTIDLKWVSKQVRFKSPLFEPDLDSLDLDLPGAPGEILGGMPILSGSLVTPSGIPGDLGQLTGSIEVPTGVALPVSVTVSWFVTADGEVDDETGMATGARLLDGTDFFAPAGLTGVDVNMIFAPTVFEASSGGTVPAPVARFLHAEVTLTAGTETFTVQPPPIRVLVVPLGVPKLLALFRHRDYATTTDESHPWPSSPAWESWVLLVVPADSPISSVEEMRALLRTLGDTLSSLSRLVGFAAFALGIQELASAVAAQVFVQLLKTNAIANLKTIEFRGWDWDRGYLGPADHASALILLGPTGAVVELNNGYNNAAGFGRFTVTVDGTPLGVAFVRNFKGVPRDPATQSVAGGTLVVTNAARGYVVDEARDIQGFDNEVSSLRFP